MTLRVYSGESCKCDVGLPVGAKDRMGRDLHTGDIVIVWHGEYLGTDIERWDPSEGLTCVIADQYQSYSDGSITQNPVGLIDPFVMGIKDCKLDHPA